MKELLSDFITDKLFTALVTKIPLFGLNPIAYIIKYYVGKLIALALVETELVLVKIDKLEDRLAYDRARQKYENALQKGDENEIQKTRKALIDAFRRHVKFN